jgi:hypothetical protein
VFLGGEQAQYLSDRLVCALTAAIGLGVECGRPVEFSQSLLHQRFPEFG